MLARIRNKVLNGRRLSADDALRLFESSDIFSIGSLAAYANGKKNGKKAFFVRNRHINPTNICINRCKFCAFSRSPGQEGAYELTVDEIIAKLRPYCGGKGRLPGITEAHIVGGLHPEWDFGRYLGIISAIRRHFPGLHIKAFTAVEIDHFSRISGLGLEGTLKALKKAGLGTMPGGGAEIFASGVRAELCPEKISGARWIEVMEAAHGVGIRTNATMLYGHIESHEDRVDHLMRLREMQDRTGGFQAFIPLAYHPKNTRIQGGYTSGIDDLRTIAVSRLVLDNFDHIKAYWIMLGEKISQLSLCFGADDIDGTIIEEKITRSAGGLTAGHLTADQLAHLIRKAGKTPVERDSFYRKVRVYG
ncbi:MAG: aminofutalosine synthase MqnE [Nitrospiraceae bacterium]|nr:aminofutalosine synthase MqnE [Nitrospiraceae bacterium]